MRGKPMKTLASVLGVSLSAISKIEKGYRRIDEKQLDSFLNDRPTSFIANYLDNGYSFSRYDGTNSETIIMLHGWGVRANSMAEQAEMLNHRGWTVLNYDYPSSEKHIEQHAISDLSHIHP